MLLPSKVGQSAGTQTSYLIRSKTAKGESVLRVDRDKDYQVGPKDEALVIRGEKDGQWGWSPVTDVKQLQDFLSKATPEDRRENLGLWTDARSWLVIPADGQIQENEVVTMGQAAQNLRLVDSDTHYNSKYYQDDAWSNHYASVDPSKVSVEIRSSAGGELPVLNEPQVISKSTVQYTTIWGLYGTGWRPAETNTITYTP